MMPATIGSISRPESAAERPELICRNVGTKAIAENMPRPTTRAERRRDDEGPVAEQRHRDDRLGRPELDRDEHDDRDDEEPASSASTGQERPALAATEVGEQDQRRRRDRQRARCRRSRSGVVLRLRGSVSANQPMANAAMPTGTLIQKHHCQPSAA